MRGRNMAKVQSIFAAVTVIFINFLCVLAEWNTKDYLKREHSLIKPYSGQYAWIIGPEKLNSEQTSPFS